MHEKLKSPFFGQPLILRAENEKSTLPKYFRTGSDSTLAKGSFMEIWKKTDVMSSVHCTRRCWQNLQAKNKVNPYHTRIKQAKYIDDIRAR